MITCKLCNTALNRNHLRRDGSLLCPVCGQIYWKAAVDKATRGVEQRIVVTGKHVKKHLLIDRI